MLGLLATALATSGLIAMALRDGAGPLPSLAPFATGTPLTPPAGDVPGADLEDLARPPGSVRIWYRETRTERLVLIDLGYASLASLDEVLSHYRATFRGRWSYGDIIVTGDRTRYFVIRGEQEATIDIAEGAGIVTVDIMYSRPRTAAASRRPDVPEATPREVDPERPRPTPGRVPTPAPTCRGEDRADDGSCDDEDGGRGRDDN